MTILFKLNLIYMLLNFRGCVKVKCFLFFIIIFTNLIPISLMLIKLLLAKINISSVYIPIILNIIKL